jgi:hypothetical protein
LIIGSKKIDPLNDSEKLLNEKLTPSTLFMYPGEKQFCSRRLVIKDFCFPTGISILNAASIESLKRTL